MANDLQSVLIQLEGIRQQLGHIESTVDSEKETRKRTTKFLIREVDGVKEKVQEIEKVEAGRLVLREHVLEQLGTISASVKELVVTVRDLKTESDTRKKFRTAVMVQGAALAGILIKLIFDWFAHGH